MPKPGVMQLPVNIFPELKSTYSEDELKHMLIITGMEVNQSGLKIFQTIPELLKNNEVITKKPVSNLLFPIVKNALEKEFIHARLICLLNNTSGAEKIDYIITVVFIADNNNCNFRVADIYLGEPNNGKWADPEYIEQFAKLLDLKTYTR